MQNENNTKIVRYPLATAGKRIIAKVIDIAIISCLIIALGFAIFCTDPNFQWNSKLVIAGWRYGLFVSLMAVVFFGLMLLLPRLWKKTIGMKIFKLEYHRKTGRNYTFGLFKHELFVWEVIVIVAFAMGWTLAGLNQLQIDSLLDGAGSIFTSSVPEGLDKACYYVGTAFSCLYGVSILFLIAIVIAICIRNGKPAFHDKYSNVYLISKKKVEVSNHSKSNKKQPDEIDIKIPGGFSEESLEEIDKI